jgi:UDPglucose 6-dehydrogenase
MTTVGFIGLGKLGLPVALAIESRGHEVIGYDVNPAVAGYLRARRIPYHEERAPELLAKTELRFAPVEAVVRESEFIFVPVQTPHEAEYEGITRIPDDRVDFDYTYLLNAVQSVAYEASSQRKHVQLIINSTVLPGTMEREIKPLLGEHGHLVYNPAFIAMGTTIQDFLHTEFVLIGADPDNAIGAERLAEFYKTLHDHPSFITDLKTAELIKVAYNTFIGAKIVFANTMMEICHKLGADVDDLTRAMSMATTRIISSKYMYGGMGDGGGCHPRDNIAMSWLADRLALSHNIFEDLMKAREDQTFWLARMVEDAQRESGLPVILLGRSYKPGTNLVVGSPAILLSNLLHELGVDHDNWDPYIDEPRSWPAAVYFIATNHPDFRRFEFPEGSIVIDPWRMVTQRDSFELVAVGRRAMVAPAPAAAH